MKLKTLTSILILSSVLFSCKKDKTATTPPATLCTGGTGKVFINGVEQQITSITTFLDSSIICIDTSVLHENKKQCVDGIAYQTTIVLKNGTSLILDVSDYRDGNNTDSIRATEYTEIGTSCMTLNPNVPSDVCAYARFLYKLNGTDPSYNYIRGSLPDSNQIIFTKSSHDLHSCEFHMKLMRNNINDVVFINGILDSVCINRR